ncbi:hypothetical protein TNCV_4502111 [Trichonephila clavipes]|nr:hypothetical protein TNCV_4502111 [Trichonephila clavipes]
MERKIVRCVPVAQRTAPWTFKLKSMDCTRKKKKAVVNKLSRSQAHERRVVNSCSDDTEDPPPRGVDERSICGGSKSSRWRVVGIRRGGSPSGAVLTESLNRD